MVLSGLRQIDIQRLARTQVSDRLVHDGMDLRQQTMAAGGGWIVAIRSSRRSTTACLDVSSLKPVRVRDEVPFDCSTLSPKHGDLVAWSGTTPETRLRTPR